jgi:hypothetical protein
MENVGVIVTLCTKPEDSTVGIVEDTDVASHPRRPESSKIYFPFIKRLDRTWGPSIVSNGWQGPSKKKKKGRGTEFDHLFLCSAEFNNVWSYTVTPALYSHRLGFDYRLGHLTFTSFVYCEFWGFLDDIFLIIILSFKILKFYRGEYSYCCILVFYTVWSGKWTDLPYLAADCTML